MKLFDISIIVLLAPPLMKATSRHWLHVFKVLNSALPYYLDDLICKHRPSCSLRSSDTSFFFVFCTFSKLVIVDLAVVLYYEMI